MKIVEGNIIPKVGIGNIKLNSTKEELIEIIGLEYEKTPLELGEILSIENAKFWIAQDGKLDQIGVGNGFQGLYNNAIGIGSTLADVIASVGNYKEVGDTFEIENERGICFELEDVDDWEELSAPIEFIYVFRVNRS